MSSKRRCKPNDRLLRRLANKAHKTYQSPSETEEKGCMKQWIVNRVLGLFGDR